MTNPNHLEALTAAFGRAGIRYEERAAEAGEDMLRGYGLPEDARAARAVELAPGQELVFDEAGSYLGTLHEADGFDLFQPAGEAEERQKEGGHGWPPSEGQVKALAVAFPLDPGAWSGGRSEEAGPR